MSSFSSTRVDARMSGVPAAPVVVPAIGILGLAVGSFLNVVIHRVPRDKSVLTPGSHCPVCDAPISPHHNVPLLSWLMLRARCANCGTRISVRYPAVEAATAVLFVIVGLRVADLGRSAAIPAYLYLTAIGVALTLIDIDVHRLPDRIVLPSYPIGGALLVGASLVDHDLGALWRGALGCGALFMAYLFIATLYPGGMGFGDVKLAGVLGAYLAYLSWPTFLVGAFGAFLLGGTVGAAVIVAGRGTGKTPMPYGPFMIVSAIGAVFWANPVWRAYTHVTLGS